MPWRWRSQALLSRSIPGHLPGPNQSTSRAPGAGANFIEKELPGRVVAVDRATAATFSLLPQNSSSGNFTKVTQRLPVRISIAQSDELLRPGMMVEVAIEVR